MKEQLQKLIDAIENPIDLKSTPEKFERYMMTMLGKTAEFRHDDESEWVVGTLNQYSIDNTQILFCWARVNGEDSMFFHMRECCLGTVEVRHMKLWEHMQDVKEVMNEIKKEIE